MAKRFAKYGENDIPFGEPGWYRGDPTPFYNENHVRFRKKVRDFVETHIKPFATKWDEQKSFPIEELRLKAYNAGVLSPCWPKEYGGTPPEGGWDEFMNVIWHDELGRSNCAGAIITMIGIKCMSIPHALKYGSKFLIEKYAMPVIRGEKGMCITLTEPDGGSDLGNLTTTAVKTPCGKYYIVNGQKKFITGGMTGHYFSTLLRTGGPGHAGCSLMIIDKNLPGVHVAKIETQGWWAGNTTRVTFDDVKVPVENLVGKEGMGFPMMADVMNGERFVAVISATRGARALMAIGIRYARERITFGKPLVKNQVIRHKIANMARLVESAQNTVDNLAFQLDAGANPKDIGGPMALAKVQATQALEYCAREASQIMGGNSFVRGGKGEQLERAVREIRVATVGGGSEEILMDLAMRQCKL